LGVDGGSFTGTLVDIDLLHYVARRLLTSSVEGGWSTVLLFVGEVVITIMEGHSGEVFKVRDGK